MHVIFVAITPFPKIGGGWTFLTQMSSGMGGRRHTTAVVSPKQMPSAWMTVINRTAQIVRVAFRYWFWFFVRMVIVGFAFRREVYLDRLYLIERILEVTITDVFILDTRQ